MSQITTFPTSLVQGSAEISLIAVAAFSALLVLLHFLKPELELSWRVISEYEIGRHGWMMRLAFFCWSVSFFALAVALFQQDSMIAEVLLTLVGTGACIAAIFATDPITAPRGSISKTAKLHNLGGLLVIPVIPLAAAVVGWSISGNPLVASIQSYLLEITLLPWLGLIVQIVPLFRSGGAKAESGPKGRRIGWPNRFMVFTYVAWLTIVALAIVMR